MSDELREALEWVDRAVTANDGAFGPHTIEMFEVVVEAAQAHLNCIDPPDWMIQAIQGTGLGIMAARANQLARAALLEARSEGTE